MKNICRMNVDFLAQDIYGNQLHMGWSHWGSWSACSTTCGEGEMLRSRTCTGPCLLNEHGAHEAKPCNLASCQGKQRSKLYLKIFIKEYLHFIPFYSISIMILFIYSSNGDIR